MALYQLYAMQLSNSIQLKSFFPTVELAFDKPYAYSEYIHSNLQQCPSAVNGILNVIANKLQSLGILWKH